MYTAISSSSSSIVVVPITAFVIKLPCSLKPFHPPIVFHDDSQSATSPGVFQILKEEFIDRGIQKYSERKHVPL